mgnify:CR=1 FL=1
MQIAEKAIEKLHNTKGVEKIFLLDEYDRKKIIQLEERDEQMAPMTFGKKHNAGMKQALRSDFLISFLTNREYDWPKNNLKLIHRGEIIGEDISDPDEINRLKQSEHHLFGNIVIYNHKFEKYKEFSEPPVMHISAKPCPEIEEIAPVSEAIIASPSRLTDKYIKSKINSKNEIHVGSFLVGVNLDNAGLEKSSNELDTTLTGMSRPCVQFA